MASKTKKAAPKKKGTDIPLDNIPERAERQSYTDEFKISAVERVKAGESADAVARALGIPSSSVISGWKGRIDKGLPVTNRVARQAKPADPGASDIAAILRGSLARATKARDDRLDAAAAIAEADIPGKEGAAIAKSIRSHRRTTSTS